MNIAEHGKRSRHAAGSRISQNRDEGEPLFLDHINCCRGTGHLHQGQNAFLHASTAGSRDGYQRIIAFKRHFGRLDNAFADRRSHGTAHKREVQCRNHAGYTADFALRNLDGIVIAGSFAVSFQTVGIFFGIAKFEWVFFGSGKADFIIFAVIEKHFQPLVDVKAQMMSAFGADIKGFLHLLRKKHLSADGTFDP